MKNSICFRNDSIRSSDCVCLGLDWREFSVPRDPFASGNRNAIIKYRVASREGGGLTLVRFHKYPPNFGEGLNDIDETFGGASLGNNGKSGCWILHSIMQVFVFGCENKVVRAWVMAKFMSSRQIPGQN